MELQVFDDPGALVTWVNDNSITQTMIVQIWQREGKWYLFYYP